MTAETETNGPVPVRLLLLGPDADRKADALRQIDSLDDPFDVIDGKAGAPLPERTPPPEIIVVLQAHPDDASPRQVQALLNAFPLARLIVCCSAWCLSDGRTRALWPQACRVPADQLLSRLRRELAVLAGGAQPLPLTANRDECWEYDFAVDSASRSAALNVAIDTPDPAIGSWLSATLTAAGHRLVETNRPDVLLYDVDPWTPDRAGSLAALRREHPALPIVGLIGFPQSPQQQELSDAGVRSVVAKTARLEQLSHSLCEAASGPASHPTLQLVGAL